MDPQHGDGVRRDQQRQGIMYGSRRLAAAVPGGQHVLADMLEFTGIRHDHDRPPGGEDDVFWRSQLDEQALGIGLAEDDGVGGTGQARHHRFDRPGRGAPFAWKALIGQHPHESPVWSTRLLRARAREIGIEPVRQIGRRRRADATGGGHVGMDENVLDGHGTSSRLLAQRTTVAPAAPLGSLMRINSVRYRSGRSLGIAGRSGACRNWHPRDEAQENSGTAIDEPQRAHPGPAEMMPSEAAGAWRIAWLQRLASAAPPQRHARLAMAPDVSRSCCGADPFVGLLEPLPSAALDPISAVTGNPAAPLVQLSVETLDGSAFL